MNEYDPGRLQGLLDSHFVGLDKLVGALAISLSGDIHNPLRQVLIVGLPPYLHTNTLSFSRSADAPYNEQAEALSLDMVITDSR